MATVPADMFGIEATSDDDDLPTMIVAFNPVSGWRAAFINPASPASAPEDRPIIYALAGFAVVDVFDPIQKIVTDRVIRPMVALDAGEVVDVDGLDDMLLCLLPPHVTQIDQTTYIREALQRIAADAKRAEAPKR